MHCLISDGGYSPPTSSSFPLLFSFPQAVPISTLIPISMRCKDLVREQELV